MNLSQALQDSGAIDSMAQQFGVDRAVALQAANAMLPAIVAGMGRDHVGAGDSRDGGGLGGLLGGLLGGAGGAGAGAGGAGGGLLEQVLAPGATDAAPGNDILGQIFGSKDVSRGVAEEAAGITGLPAVLLKRMLPVLVMAVVGYAMRGGFSQGSAPAEATQAPAPRRGRAGGAGRGARAGAGAGGGGGAARRGAGAQAGGMGDIGRAVLGGIVGRVVAGAVRGALRKGI